MPGKQALLTLCEPTACCICHLPLSCSAAEQLIAAAGIAPVPTRCQVCRLLKRTEPLPRARPAPRSVPVVPAVLPVLADHPKTPRYGQQPMRLYGEVVAWMQQHGGRLPLVKDFERDPQLPGTDALFRQARTVEAFYVQLEATGMAPGVHAAYRAQRQALRERGAAQVRQQRQVDAQSRARREQSRYAALKAAHRCVTCGAPAHRDGTAWRARCLGCLAEVTRASRAWHRRTLAVRRQALPTE